MRPAAGAAGSRARGVVRRCAALLLAAALSTAVPTRPVEREAELEIIRDRIMALQIRLRQVRQQVGGVRRALAETEVALELQEARLAEASTARQGAEESLARVQGEIAEVQWRLEKLRGQLRDRLVDLYRVGRQGYLRLFFSIRSSDRLLAGLRQVRYLALRDRELLARHDRTLGELSFRRQELESHRQEVEHWLAAETARTQELRQLRRRQASLLARLETEDRSLSRQAVELAEKEERLASLLDYLYGRLDSSPGGTPIRSFRGVLDWPLQGRVVRGFGPRLDLRYRTRVPHNGIELAAESGSEVRAVFTGQVLFAAPLSGYGLTVVLHHPGRVFSLYAGLREVRIEPDAMVSLEQVIGTSRERLYFEIRDRNRPVDPLEWLR